MPIASTLTPEQEQERKKNVETRQFNRKRDKLFHENKQNPEKDLEGRTYTPYDQLFMGLREKAVEILLGGSVQDLLNYDGELRDPDLPDDDYDDDEQGEQGD